jgi:hypothetical protein
MSFALAKAIHGQKSNRNMLVLFDPGLTSTWISSNKLPEGTKGNKVPPSIGMTIAATPTKQLNSRISVFLSFTKHDISLHTRQECLRHPVVTT